MIRRVTNQMGAVCIKTVDSWMGVSNHTDSIPTILGQEVWDVLQENIHSLERFSKMLFEGLTWKGYLLDGLCQYCGKHDVGRPCSVNRDLYNRTNDKNEIVALDPNSKGHKHIKYLPVVTLEDEAVQGYWARWIYVIDVKKELLEIFVSVIGEGTNCRNKDKAVCANYRYFPLGLFNLNGEEPDWDEIERKACSVIKYYYEKSIEHINSKNIHIIGNNEEKK